MSVIINSKVYTCSYNNQIIKDASNFKGKLNCPNSINSFCQTFMTCDNFCSK